MNYRKKSPKSIVPRPHELISHPLEHLDYFTEWGSKRWQYFLDFSIREVLGKDLTGLNILDIGTRYGKAAACFALLGGNVTGIDINEDYLGIAEKEAYNLGVEKRTQFVQYNGDLDIFPPNFYDVVFCKSVLVIVNELESFLQSISKILKPGGTFVFIENGKGNFVLHKLRAFKHRKWDYTSANYFTNKEIDLIKRIFHSANVKKSGIPPVYLIYGKNILE